MALKEKNVHYFPGHMQKTIRTIGNYVKIVDLIIEIVDARAPYSSRNPILDGLCGGKPRLILLSKEDLADEAITRRWVDYFSASGIKAVSSDLRKGKLVKVLSSSCATLLTGKREKEARLGMKKQPIRAMVIGIPNVGKSTLINNISGRRAANVGNKAGVTRAEQWLKLNDDFTLLDTPGVLPMNYPDGAMAVRLAILGSMREDVLPTRDLAYALLGYMRENYPTLLSSRFLIDDLTSVSSDDALLRIANRRGLLEGPSPSLEKAAYLLIKEFKDGLLGRASLEAPEHRDA